MQAMHSSFMQSTQMPFYIHLIQPLLAKYLPQSHYFISQLKIITFQLSKAIFASALNYVQEREEPVDFLDIFYDYEKSKDDMGISEDIQQFKQQKKIYLSPLKQKNQNGSSINNSSINVSSGQDYFGGRSNSVFYTSQNNRLSNPNTNNNNTNKSQKNSKLSPLKLDNLHNSPKRLFTNNPSGQSTKNFKNTLGMTNSMKGIGLNNQSVISQREHSRSQQFQNKQGNGEIGNLDDMYKSALFSNNLNRQRLQQIEFYPSPSANTKSNFFSNHHHPSLHQDQTQQDSAIHYDFNNDTDNPYSLKNGNHILKEHFNLQISNVPDPRKKWVLRKVNKSNNNNNNFNNNNNNNNINNNNNNNINNNILSNPQKDGKQQKKTKLHQNSNELQYLSTQTDEQNALESVQQSTYSAKEQILFQSLKPNFQDQAFPAFSNTPFQLGQKFPQSTSSNGSNQLINLNNLMISVKTPYFFTQQQFFNQSNFPKTAPSGAGETRKERGFQIKKHHNSHINNFTNTNQNPNNNNNNNANNNNNIGLQQHLNMNKPQISQSQAQMKIDSRVVYIKDQQTGNNFFTSSKKNNQLKSDSLQKTGKFKKQIALDDHYVNSSITNASTKNKGNQQSSHRDNNLNPSKTSSSFYPIQMNVSIPLSPIPQVDNNQKTLPLYCLNFNKTLEKRLLLNSLGI